MQNNQLPTKPHVKLEKLSTINGLLHDGMKCRQQSLVIFWGAGIRKALHDLKEDLLHDDKDDHPQISQHPHTSVQPQIIEQPHHMSHHPHTTCDQPHITSGYVYAPVSLIEHDEYVRSFSFPSLQQIFSFFGFFETNSYPYVASYAVIWCSSFYVNRFILLEMPAIIM